MSAPTPVAVNFSLTKSTIAPLNSNHRTLYKYTVHALDAQSKKPFRTHLATVTESVAAKVPFPPGSKVDSSHDTLVTDEPMTEARSKKPIKDVFFVVNMFDAKKQQAKETKDDIPLGDYIEIKSGSAKKGGRDNRKWVKFGDLQPFGGQATNSQDRETALASVACDISPEADRAFALWFQEDKTDLNDLTAVVPRALDANFDSLTRQFAVQLLAKQMRRQLSKGHTPLVVVENRVLFEKGEPALGLEPISGLRAKIVYDSDGKANLLREPCKTHFFQPILVSDFLEKFFGPSIVAEKEQGEISSVLKDVKVMVATVDGQSSGFATIVGTCESSKPNSSNSAAKRTAGKPLSSPKMPWINIGTVEKPEYLPAELCKIVEQQIFRGEVPIVPSDITFETTSTTKRNHTLKSGDPYPKAQSAGFNIVFVNLVSEEDDKPAINGDVMASFREEVGRRYNNSLETALTAFQVLELTQYQVCDTLATFLKPGIRSVVIIVTPYGHAVSQSNDLRKVCDTRLGVQCRVVTGEQVKRRFHPVHTVGMKKLTGGIVKDIFARAKAIALDQDLTAVSSRYDGHLLGVHVHKLDLGEKKGEKKPSVYLVDSVSISGDGGHDVRVTNHIFRADDDESFVVQLSSIIEGSHRDKAKSLSVYINRLGENYHEVLNKLNATIDTWFKTDRALTENHSFVLTSVVSGPKIWMLNKGECNLIKGMLREGASQMAELPEGVSQMSLDEISSHEQATSRVTAMTYNVPPQVIDAKSYSASLATFWKSSSTVGVKSFVKNEDGEGEAPYYSSVSTKSYGALLTSQDVPAILYLAEEASKRSRLHVFEKSETQKVKEREQEGRVKKGEASKKAKESSKATEQVGDAEVDGKKAVLPKCDYGIARLHRELKDTFYFL